MTSIPRFDSSVHCEEMYSFTQSEYDEVMQASAVDENWQGYSEWSRELETSLAPSVLYIDPRDGKVKQKPEPPSLGRISGIEL